MIDQNILYAECPCGSGKKFKFCCYPIVRGELPKNPTRADVNEVIRQRSLTARFSELSGDKVILDLDYFHELISRGLQYMRAGRYKDARDEFLKAKKDFGMMPTAYNNLALCALVQGDLKEAEKWVLEAVQKFPEENPFGMAMLADIRYLNGDVAGAIDVINRAEQIVPPSVDQAARLCESMAHFQNHKRIVRYAEKSGYADDPEIAFYCGIALANLRKATEAARYLRIAVRGVKGDYAKLVLDGVTSGARPDTLCRDWMYFRHNSFTLFAGVSKGVSSGGDQQAKLSSEVLAELVEVETNDGYFDIPTAIKMLASIMSKRTERILDAVRSDCKRPKDIRKAADDAYRGMFDKDGLGTRIRDQEVGSLQQMIITEEAATNASLAPEYEESYFKAVRVCMDLDSGKKELKEALRILEDLHKKLPDNPAVANNYASALSLTGHVDKSIKVVRDCFAQHPEYVFGAANYLKLLILGDKLDEAKAMIENYRLPQRIHPEAYFAWCRVEMQYYELVGDQERLENVRNGMESVMKEFHKQD